MYLFLQVSLLFQRKSHLAQGIRFIRATCDEGSREIYTRLPCANSLIDISYIQLQVHPVREQTEEEWLDRVEILTKDDHAHYVACAKVLL